MPFERLPHQDCTLQRLTKQGPSGLAGINQEFTDDEAEPDEFNELTLQVGDRMNERGFVAKHADVLDLGIVGKHEVDTGNSFRTNEGASVGRDDRMMLG